MHKPNPRRIIPILLLAGVGLWWLQSLVVAQRETRELTANGTIEADEVAIGAQRPARLVKFEAPEGESVKAGQVIATLDSSELKAHLEQATGGAALAAARLQQLLRGTRVEELRSAKGQSDQTRALLAGAQRTLANAKLAFERRTTLKQALEAAETQRNVAAEALRQAETAESGADSALKTATEEYETSIALRQSRDAARQQLETAHASLRAAKAKLEDMLKGVRIEQIRAAEAVVAQAGAGAQGARVEERNARTELNRAQQQHAGQAISDQQLDAAQTRAEVATFKLAQTQQAQAQAEAKLLELRNGARAEEIDAAQANVQHAHATVEGGQKSLENAQQAYELRLGARGAMKAAKTQRDVAQVQVASARALLAGAELAVKNARTAYVDALAEKQAADSARAQYESAVGQLESAQAILELKENGATKEEIDQARGQLQQARGALSLARTQHEQGVIKAPVDGVITRHVARVGEVVTPGATIAKLVELHKPHLTMYVPLPQLGKVKIGQRVNITTDTYPHKVYVGRVYWISDTPEFTPRNVQTQDERIKLVFQVKVAVDNFNRELKPGMPADARIRFQ